jgi:hypothetical protein
VYAALRLLPFVALFGLAACATAPTGPSIAVLPGSTKSFDEFRYDDGTCRQYAHEQVAGLTPDRAAEQSGVRSAAVGALLGAAAGAAIDGHSGAGVGAGVGLLCGGLAGTAAANQSAYDAQRRYDIGYQQCMYSKGHRVPVSGRYAPSVTSAPTPYYPPPPPYGYAPPPPR